MDQVPFDQSAAAVAVGALVMAMTQATKRWISDDSAPIAVGFWTLLAVGVWAFSQAVFPPARTSAFGLLSIAVNVYVSAIGLYATATHVTQRRQRSKDLAKRAVRARHVAAPRLRLRSRTVTPAPAEAPRPWENAHVAVDG